MKTRILILAMCLVQTPIINARLIKELSVSFIDETISFPFTRYRPVHPGVEIGIALRIRETGKTIKRINSYLGGFYHRKVENAFYAKQEYQYTVKIKNTIGIDLPAGLGYLHTFYPGELYVQNENSGEFKKVKQFGRAHAMANIGFGISYIKYSVIPFIRQEFAIEAPFANGIPFIPHSLLSFGVKTKL